MPISLDPISSAGGNRKHLRGQAHQGAEHCEALDGRQHSMALGGVYQPAEAGEYMQHFELRNAAERVSRAVA